MTLFIVVNIGGLIVLVASVLAPVFLRRVPVQAMSAPWQRLWRKRWKIGTILCLLSLFSCWEIYPTVQDGRWEFVRGIPFVVGGGVYGGVEDPPPRFVVITYLLNLLFWLLLPQFVLWVTSGRRHGPETGGSAPESET